MDVPELLWQCCTDSALYGVRNAAVMVRRISRSAELQTQMAMLQNDIRDELERRKREDTEAD